MRPCLSQACTLPTPFADDVAAAAEVQLGSVAADSACTSVEEDTVTVATPPAEPYLVGVIYAPP